METAEQIRSALQQAGRKGLSLEEVARSVNADAEHVERQLEELQQAGETIRWSRRWHLISRSDWLTGVIKQLRRGDALLLVEARGDATHFIPERHLGDARDGDLVAVRPAGKRSGRSRPGSLPEAKVDKVLQRAHQRLVGIVASTGEWTLVRPLDPRIQIEAWLQHAELSRNTVVQVDLTEHNYRDGVVGNLLHVLGDIDDPARDTSIVIAQFELPHEFSSATLTESKELPADPTADDWTGREDLRSLPTMTIDGADARDFDDAISIERRGEGFRLWVHIADVSHYVEPDSPFDIDAQERGTSVYFADRVVPMLPEALSNGLCSLKPGVPRLAVTARLDFNDQGRLSGREIFPSVIQSDLRATYSQVEDYLTNRDPEQPVLSERAKRESRPGPRTGRESKSLPPRVVGRGAGDPGEGKGDEIIDPAITALLDIADELLTLRLAVREERGALDLEIPESKVVVDRSGRPRELVAIERLRAHRLIEEFMLAANEAVATELEMQQTRSVHRVHESPDPAAAEELAAAVKALGFEAPRDLDALHAAAFQDLLHAAERRNLTPMVSRLVLRSLQRAHYAHESAGHFALALRHYTHFTSPIRRYPDLLVHRSLKLHWLGTEDPLRASHYKELAAHCSATERLAEQAERELTLIKKLRWLEGSAGEHRDGTVVGVAKIGLFVELDEILVDGVVPQDGLSDDRYRLEEENYRWIGDRHGRSFGIGDRVEVEIRKVDVTTRRLDLALSGMPDTGRGQGGRAGRGRGSWGSGPSRRR